MRLKNLHQVVLYFFIATFGLFNLTCCKETETLDLTGGNDTTITVQQKQVLIEEVTGVRCVNCPEAHELAKSLDSLNGGRLELVSLHTGFFAVPYANSQHNFVTECDSLSEDIETYLGGPLNYPLAAIDRSLPSGQTDLLLDKAFWAGQVAARLSEPLQVELHLQNDYNATTRVLSVTLTANYLSDVADAQKFTVLITESGIVDPQENTDGVEDSYVHNNVLRTVLTDATGDAITEATTSGTELQRTYNFTIPTTWLAENCRVIALVAKETPDTKEVLQVVGENVQ